MEEQPTTVPNTPTSAPAAATVVNVNDSTPPEEPKKSNMALWLIAIVLIVALIGGVFWYMSSQSGAPTTEPGIDVEAFRNRALDLDS